MSANSRTGRITFFAAVMITTMLHSHARPAAGSNAAPEIWFTPLSWEVSPATKRIDYSEHDFPALLQQNAPWQKAAQRIGVVTLPGNVVWSYPDLPAVVSFFRNHAFKTALSFGMLYDDGQCGKRVEGISQDRDFNREAVNIAKMWKAAGGELGYVVMDAPLGYGHFLEPRCTLPIPEVAGRVAATLTRILAYFPDAEVVDAEGPARMPNPQWFAMMSVWFEEFRLKSGHPIDVVALDLHWRDLRPANSWQDTARGASAFFRARGVRTGLILNDDQNGPGVTDAAWMEANRRHISDVANGSGLGLDYLQINEWMGHPRKNLPENDPVAYTSLVNFAYESFYSKN